MTGCILLSLQLSLHYHLTLKMQSVYFILYSLLAGESTIISLTKVQTKLNFKSSIQSTMLIKNSVGNVYTFVHFKEFEVKRNGLRQKYTW